MDVPTYEIDSAKLDALLRSTTPVEAWALLEFLGAQEKIEASCWVEWDVMFGAARFGLLEYVAHFRAHQCFAALCQLGFGLHWAFLPQRARNALLEHFKRCVVKLCVVADLLPDPPEKRHAFEAVTAATAACLRRIERPDQAVLVATLKSTLPLAESEAALDAGLDKAVSDFERVVLRLAS